MQDFFVKVDKGTYSCGDIGISKQEWENILALPENEKYIDVLLCFLREPEHKSNCANLAMRYGESAGYYVMKINKFNAWVQKHLNRFRIIGSDGIPTIWPICMEYGWIQGGGSFSWQLRPELVEVLQKLLMQRLVAAYRVNLEEKGGLEACDELYKWKFAAQCQGKGPEELLQFISSTPKFNLMDMRYAWPSLQWLWKTDSEFIISLLNELLDESKPLIERYKKYYTSITSYWKNVSGKTSPADERSAGAFLALAYPQKYAFYKWDVYEGYCNYIGEKVSSRNEHLEHFIKQLIKLKEVVLADTELMSMVEKETESIIHSDVYLTHDIMWQMLSYGWIPKEMGKVRQRAYWFGGYSFHGNDNQFDRFIENGIWEGSGTNKVNKDIEQIRPGDIIMLKSSYTIGTNHKTSALKIKAVGIVKSMPAKAEGAVDYTVEVDYKVIPEKEFTGFSGSYQQTFHHVTDDYFTKYAIEILDMKEPSKYQEYIDLLVANKNLVLTGAPGTGKTYLAREIAKDLIGDTEDPNQYISFVQFHPSYDYSDFVEGLRPLKDTKGDLGFERKDGSFKKLCKAAIKNIEDSHKSTEELTVERTFAEKYQELIDMLENGDITDFELKTSGKKMEFVKVSDFNNIILRTPNSDTDRTYTVSFDRLTKLSKVFPDIKSLDKISNISEEIRVAIGGCNASSYWSVLREVYKRGLTLKAITKSVDQVKKMNYVFIIDEINRGELSKIFGELFFAIDPGYRGNKESLVQTQYQNLVPEEDCFAKGFYVPENVYILATMNDIDRSVESMDFAMRRRFAWKEVKPEDRIEMWGEASWAQEATVRMNNLNKLICKTHGLGKAYQVGPAYFLKLDNYSGDFSKLWDLHLSILLQEYLRGFADADETFKQLETAYNTTTEIEL